MEHEPGFTPIIEMGARQYDPLLGRFIEVDPVEGGTPNNYVYPTDPINRSDLSGMCEAATEACVIGILRGTESSPAGFGAWLIARSGGRITYAKLGKGRRVMKSNGGCSSPFGNTGTSFNFTNACKTHDLGYDLMRFFGSSGRRGSIRRAVDTNFFGDMNVGCSGRSVLLRGQCLRWAMVYYGAVAANSARQLYRAP